MTNNQIISEQTFFLISEGIIKVDEEIHTYNGWKERGYTVKKGEHAVAKFPIWKYTNNKRDKTLDENTENAEPSKAIGRCFMKKSAFFSTSQVERKEA